MATRRGKVGEIFNLARQDGPRWRDGAEHKAHLSRQTALRLAALARARLENLAYLVAPPPASVRLLVRDGMTLLLKDFDVAAPVIATPREIVRKFCC